MSTSSFLRLFFEQAPELSPPVRGGALLLELLLALLSYMGTDDTQSGQCQASHNIHRSAAPAPASSFDVKRLEALSDSMANAHISAGTTPGLTVAIARDGEIIFERGYGLADVELNVSAGTASVYGVRSITKQFTAAAVLRLVDAGKINLDAPITEYLPDYPVQGRRVTVRHLLNHTSGITGSRSESKERPYWYRLDITYEEMVDMWGHQPFAFEPGTQHDYNNHGYYLLGEIIGRVTGTPYGEYVENELLRPLGLEHTRFGEADRIIPNRVSGYLHRNDTLVNVPYVSMNVMRSGGGLYSTAGDLIRWTNLLHGGQVVSPESLRQMTAPTVLTNGDTIGYGFGLYIDELGGHPKIFHGGTLGFGAFLAHYPDDGVTIVVLTNASKARPAAGQIEQTLARAALDISPFDLPLTAVQMAPYEGTYRIEMGERTREVRVFAEGSHLFAQIDALRPFRLRYQGGHTFIPVPNDNMRIVFSVAAGRAEAFTIQEGRWERTTVRRKP